MGFFGKAIKGAVAGKVINEARKPENQRRVKSAFSSLRSRFSGKSAQPPAKGTRRVKGSKRTTR